MPVLDWAEMAARHFDPAHALSRQWDTPGDLAKRLDRRVRQTPALDLIDAALVRTADTPDSRLIITMPPQEGKSSRASIIYPLWMLLRDPDLRIVSASYSQGLANRNGRAVRNLIAHHPELGLRIADDHGAAHEWTIGRCPTCHVGDGPIPDGEHRGHDGGLYSVGVGGGVSGRPADVLLIDDPIKDRAQADSPTYRENVWDWWTDAASARLAPGAPVVLILTRWHHDDLAGRLIKSDAEAGWVELNIPAEADHHPERGETDPLGRQPGEFMVSARGRTRPQWEQRKRTAGKRTWASLYQGRPTPDTGNLFPRDGWARYSTRPWIVRDDGARIVPDAHSNTDVEIIQSWDLTFKDTRQSDWVVGQVWLRRGAYAYLLDQVRARAGFSESCRMILDMRAKWPQAVAILVEDKANGPAVLNALRSQVGGLIPVEPEGSKYARAVATTPLVESGNVLLPDPVTVEGTAWVTDLTDEARDFPGAKHDDCVDAYSQAVHRLLLVPMLSGQILDETYLLDDDELDLAWADGF